MYHSISGDDERGVRSYFRLTTSPARFQEHLRLLADHGFTATSLERALDAPPPGEGRMRNVVLTFDDGYADFLEHAWPTLEAFSFTASVFLPTAFIGETARQTFKGRECLTWPEVRGLSRRGVSFGSHTVSHPALRGLPWPDVRTELRASRDRIEWELGAPVTTFAYPFAFPTNDRDFVSRFCLELRDQGYRANVTTMIGRLSSGDDLLQVKRLPVNDADDRHLFLAKLAGAYDWVGTLQSAWKYIR